jgi:hypothetical protein
MPVELAAERISQQVATAALWIELDGDGGAAMDDLFGQVSRDVMDGKYAAVVSATADLLDPVAAALDADAFADPAWDMLLDLLQAEIAQLRVPVSSLRLPPQCRQRRPCDGSRQW